MIDWDLVERVGGQFAGRPSEPGPTSEALARVCDESLESVVSYTRLEPAAAVPPAESISRREWIAANAASMAPLIEGPAAAASERASGAFRLAASTAMTLEAGAVLGIISRKILGQYDLALLPRAGDPPPRLLFVAPNLGEVGGAFGSDADDFIRWVAVHELTHAVQFGAVSWLREYLGDAAAELISSLEVPTPQTERSIGRVLSGAAGRVAGFAGTGDPMRLVLGEQELALLDRIQSAMAVVEGHAEHVMDNACPKAIPALPRIRAAMAQRRAQPGPAWRVLSKLLGLEMKMKQYRVGRGFCDYVVSVGGVEALNLVWAGPDALPTSSELQHPAVWLRRVVA